MDDIRKLAFFVLAALLLLAGCAAKADSVSVDYTRLRISLQRSACFGDCPDYRVTISGDGSIVFTTDHRPVDPVAGVHRAFSPSVGVIVPGTHHAKIAPEAVKALVDQFLAAHIFDLKSEYRYGATDAATYVIAIDTGSRKKQIVDYIGKRAGMPAAVTALEDAVDKVAGTSRWIEGTPDVIPLLQAEGFDFKSPIGQALAAKAAARGDVASLAQLQALGAPLAGKDALSPLVAAASANQMATLGWLLEHGLGKDREALLSAFGEATRSDSDQTFDALLGLITPETIGAGMSTDWLREAARNGNVHTVSALLRFRPRLNGTSSDRPIEEPPLWAAAQNSCSEERPNPNCDHRRVVRMLLDAGTDARWVHPLYRNSVLFLVSDPVIAEMLIAAGADPNLKDTDGEPIIFSISDEDVALVMVKAGLDLHAVRPADRMTLRGWARYEKWPRILALLDKAGVVSSHAR